MWVWSLGLEGPLEKEMAPHSSIFTWKMPRKEQPAGLHSTGSQRVRQDWLSTATTQNTSEKQQWNWLNWVFAEEYLCM